MSAFLPLQADDAPPPATIRAREKGTFTFYFENDYFGGTDRHYTNGVKLSWLTADLSYGAGFIIHRFQLTFMQVRRTQEFKTQAESHNYFGSVTLSYAF